MGTGQVAGRRDPVWRIYRVIMGPILVAGALVGLVRWLLGIE